MTHPSKIKGNTFERECVNKAKKAGLKAQRAYGSNGKMLLLGSIKFNVKEENE